MAPWNGLVPEVVHGDAAEAGEEEVCDGACEHDGAEEVADNKNWFGGEDA